MHTLYAAPAGRTADVEPHTETPLNHCSTSGLHTPPRRGAPFSYTPPQRCLLTTSPTTFPYTQPATPIQVTVLYVSGDVAADVALHARGTILDLKRALRPRCRAKVFQQRLLHCESGREVTDETLVSQCGITIFRLILESEVQALSRLMSTPETLHMASVFFPERDMEHARRLLDFISSSWHDDDKPLLTEAEMGELHMHMAESRRQQYCESM